MENEPKKPIVAENLFSQGMIIKSDSGNYYQIIKFIPYSNLEYSGHSQYHEVVFTSLKGYSKNLSNLNLGLS